jgi:hypothetical protein
MFLRILTLSAALIATPICPASADANSDEKLAVTLEDYASAHSECADFTDQCTVCSQVSGELVCSTPKIACIKKEITCTAPKTTSIGPKK